jgi:Uma2 family endonuclease
MATLTSATHVPLQVYLDTMYRPDRDWIDGELRERNMCEQPHSTVQGFLIQILRNHAKDWQIRVLPEQRVQTTQRNYRIADIAVIQRNDPYVPIVRKAPLLCIEILSRDDSMSEIQERIDDYFGMGVQAAWVIDPRRRKAYSGNPDGSLKAEDAQLKVAGTPIVISLADLFAELDEAEALGASDQP